MPPFIALSLYFFFLIALLIYEKKKNVNVSIAIWIPTFWFLIISSRPVVQWLNLGNFVYVEEGPMESGTPIDMTVYIFLMIMGIIALLKRKIYFGTLIANNKWVFVLIIYCGFSIFWSDYPFVAFKRYIKSIGFVIMALIVVTDEKPTEALEALIRKTSYILIPLSIVLIKYYRHIGVGFTPWGDGPFYMGVGGNKNILGRLCFIVGIYFGWCLIKDFKNNDSIQLSTIQRIIDFLFLLMTFWLLYVSNSATSLICVLISFIIFIGLKLEIVKRNISYLPILAFFVAMVVIIITYSTNIVEYSITNVFNRNMTLTDRTFLWDDLLKMVKYPIWGTGFESFWLGDRLNYLWDKYTWKPTMAHNGYLEIYIQIGFIGLLIWLCIIYSTFRKSLSAIINNYDLGVLKLAFLVSMIFYNVTENGFGLMTFMWFLFLVIHLDYEKSGLQWNLPSQSNVTMQSIKAK